MDRGLVEAPNPNAQAIGVWVVLLFLCNTKGFKLAHELLTHLT